MTPAEAVVELGRRGDKTILPKLDAVLKANPWVWESTGDLTRLAEQAWIDRIHGNNLLNGQCLRFKLEAMRKELCGEEANPLERLLVDRLLCCWLGAQQAELDAAMNDPGGAQVSLQVRRLEAANRRFLQACRSLAQVRRLTAGLKIEITHREEPTPRQAVKNVVAERMREENLVGAA